MREIGSYILTNISCDEVTEYSQVARSLPMYPSNQLLFASCAVAAVTPLDSCIPVCLGLGEYDDLLNPKAVYCLDGDSSVLL